MNNSTGKKGIVVGAAPLGEEAKILRQMILTEEGCCGVVAADGGIDFFVREGISPDVWIGDMDSSTQELKNRVATAFPDLEVRTLSPIKDDTDMALAVNVLVDKGCDEIFIFGGIGGKRLEHSIANIQLMHHFADRGIHLYMYSDNSLFYVLKDELRNYSPDKKGYISIFSLSDSSEIEISGLKYEYSGEIVNSYALGVSNEFCNKGASIKIKRGVALVVESR